MEKYEEILYVLGTHEALLYGFYNGKDVPLTNFKKWPIIEQIGQFEENK